MPLDWQPVWLTLKKPASVTTFVLSLADMPLAWWLACITRRSGLALGLREGLLCWYMRR